MNDTYVRVITMCYIFQPFVMYFTLICKQYDIITNEWYLCQGYNHVLHISTICYVISINSCDFHRKCIQNNLYD